MNRPITLCVSSPFEQPLSRTQLAQMWQQLKDTGTIHSKMASTLPHLIRRCEREGQPYVLTAQPGVGYHLRLDDRYCLMRTQKKDQ